MNAWRVTPQTQGSRTLPEPAAGKVDATCAAPQNLLKALELEAPGYTGNRGRLKRGWVESLEK